MQSSNEKLRKALEDSLEKDLSFVPDDKEIKKIYTPSPKFEEQMRKLIKRIRMKEKFQIIVMNKKKLSYVAVAAILILGIRLSMPLITVEEKGNEMATRPESALESNDQYEAKNNEKSDTTTEQSITSSGMENDFEWSIKSTSDDTVILILANPSADEWHYTGITRIEKIDQDKVSVVYTSDNLQEETLASASNIEETLNRFDYSMDVSGRYILYRNINENQITLELEIP
ncbi:MAG: hypothetical protein H2184_11780 [Candidatus Galacturonibacter soehngenii]|nr:hypothetical protein [Candidatus Galacturonibacter soehngenii]